LVGQEDADLAVLDPAGGPGVSPLNPGRLIALLEEAGLIDDQDAERVPQVAKGVLEQVVADPVGVPVGPAQTPPYQRLCQVLSPPVARRLLPSPGKELGHEPR
jgi:hypothetical protein